MPDTLIWLVRDASAKFRIKGTNKHFGSVITNYSKNDALSHKVHPRTALFESDALSRWEERFTSLTTAVRSLTT